MYNVLAKQIITLTRYFDENTFTTLGIKFDIKMLFGNIGLSYFTSLNQLIRE